MDELTEAARQFESFHPHSIRGSIDTFRHDSWQLLLTKPELCFRAALFLRCRLKMLSEPPVRYDTRISIGLGEVEDISEERISDSRGAAFLHSGKGLDALGGVTLGFSSPLRWFGQRTALARAVTPLLDSVALDWAPAESRAVSGALQGLTQEEIARRWPPKTDGGSISRQAVAKSLKRAHWPAVQQALRWAEEEILRALDRE